MKLQDMIANKRVACPQCINGEFEIIGTDKSRILSCKHCHIDFSVLGEIPLLVPPSSSMSSSKKEIQKFWGQLFDAAYSKHKDSYTEKNYLDHLPELRKMFQDREHLAVVELPIDNLEEKNVLEIGPGSGAHSSLFCLSGAQVTSLDITLDRVIETNRKLEIVDKYSRSFALQGDAEKLLESLREICRWNWNGAKLVIEHCDSYTEQNKNPQKGFLNLNEELKIIKRMNEEQKIPLGLTINWGRSAIEGRKIDEPENHVAFASNSGVLSGVMFSGVASDENSLYGEWRDMHAPPNKAFDIQHYEDSSLMSYENMRKTIQSCKIDEIDYMGIKLLPLPSETPLSERIAINKDAISLLEKIINEINRKIR